MRPANQESRRHQATLLEAAHQRPARTIQYDKGTPPMWSFIIFLYSLVLLGLIAATTVVAISTDNHRQSSRAQAVLKILIGASFGVPGLLAFTVRLHESGLL